MGLLKDFSIVACLAGTIGIALKFATFQIILNMKLAQGDILQGAFFPFFPNLLDVAFLILSTLYLSLLARGEYYDTK